VCCPHAQVAWAVSANHAGGYAYRLCRADATITEECFQQNHLDFAGDSSFILYPNGRAVRVEGIKTRVESSYGFCA
jgi:hypothetical protein